MPRHPQLQLYKPHHSANSNALRCRKMRGVSVHAWHLQERGTSTLDHFGMPEPELQVPGRVGEQEGEWVHVSGSCPSPFISPPLCLYYYLPFRYQVWRTKCTSESNF